MYFAVSFIRTKHATTFHLFPYTSGQAFSLQPYFPTKVVDEVHEINVSVTVPFVCVSHTASYAITI